MPAFRHRLGPARQRIYDKSNGVSAVPLQASARLRQLVVALPDILRAGDPAPVEAAAQAICNEICDGLRVGRVTVRVERFRPANARGELHGLYTQTAAGEATIKVWMMTAKRGQVVAFRTFLRTLLHEVCHHLDYTLLGLGDSLHTDGFYKRESSLFYRIGAAALPAKQPLREGGAGPVAGKK